MRKFNRKQRNFKRKTAQKSGDIFLIVCEGKCTEPKYFNFLRSKYRLSNTQIHILDTKNKSAPITVVNSAIKKRDMDKELRPDHTWCVIDSDNHSSLVKAIKVAKENEIKIALSSPCFEFWYLLHYVDSTRDYSSSNHLIRELKKHIKKYDKVNVPFDELYQLLPKAMKNAVKIAKHNKECSRTSPCTDVHKLVREFQRLQKERAKR